MREYAGIAAACPGVAPSAANQPLLVEAAPTPAARATPVPSQIKPLAPAVAATGTARPWWLWPLLGLNLLLLVGLGVWGLQMRAELQRRRILEARARKRRLAEEARAATRPIPRPSLLPHPSPPRDDELLRRLLEQ